MLYAKPSTSLLVVFRAYLASDHVTPATGKTIAITISKNGGAFGNPNAGATNATEISSGFYKVTLDTTDTGTAGPLLVRGAEAAIDDVGVAYYVGQSPADVTHWIGTAAATPTTAGVPEVDVTHVSGTAQTAGDLKAALNIIDDLIDTEVAALQTDITTLLARLTATRSGYLDNLTKLADGGLTSATFNADTDGYEAKLWVQDKNTATATDRYTVIWYKNGVPVLAGVTVPNIQVLKRDGTDLVAETALTEVGATGIWKKDETTNLMVPGESYIVKLTATIGGSTRTTYWPQGRDVS